MASRFPTADRILFRSWFGAEARESERSAVGSRNEQAPSHPPGARAVASMKSCGVDRSIVDDIIGSVRTDRSRLA